MRDEVLPCSLRTHRIDRHRTRSRHPTPRSTSQSPTSTTARARVTATIYQALPRHPRSPSEAFLVPDPRGMRDCISSSPVIAQCGPVSRVYVSSFVRIAESQSSDEGSGVDAVFGRHRE